MPNNVYIGTRYVPIFKGDWDSAIAYEGLSIVNYGGNSYTSKGPVPIGTLPTNTTYWALTGNYNGQISNLQTQIDTINNTTIPAITGDIDDIEDDITTINTNIGNLSNLNTDDKTSIVNAINERKNIKKILFIGDSYNNVVPNSGWDLTFIDLAGLSSSDYTRINISGAGFTTSPNWYDSVYNRLSSITDKELYSDVIICGGANDVTATLAALTTAMNQFKNLINTNFPNARINVGFIGYSGLAQYHSNFRVGRTNYKEAASTVGFRYLHNVEWVLYWKPYLTDNTAQNPYDYIHPNSGGLTELGRKIYQAFISGSCDVRYSAKVLLTASGVGYNVATDDIIATLENGTCFLNITGTSFALTEAAGAGAGKTIATFDSDLFNPASCLLTVPYRLPSTNNTASNTILAFVNGSLSIAANNPIPASTGVRITNFRTALSAQEI